MWKLLKKLFEKPDPIESAHMRGREMVDRMLRQAHDPVTYAKTLRDYADGTFNSSDVDYAFDRGVNARLNELGYD